MKIYVCSKKDMRAQWAVSPEWFKDPNKFFITIAGMADGEYAYPFVGSHVLRLMFDDITREEDGLILFNEEMAKKIHVFADTITGNVLYVNCAAGISRSGAVGYCLNEYFNENNPEDYNAFKKENAQIQPNPTVKRILMDELFGKIDYASIFK